MAPGETPSENPEIGDRVQTGAFFTNLHDWDESDGLGNPLPTLLIHGSGPGVTAWANWRLVLPELARHGRVLAPDMVGFGFTDRPQGFAYTLESWVRQITELLDSLGLEKVNLVGNSFGGAVSLAFSLAHPDRVTRLALMGSVGVPFPITPELDAVWGYEPSLDAMRDLLDIFAFDRSLVTDELAELRYGASIRPGFQETFSAMFPAPRQRWVEALASAPEAIRALPHETLLIHGRDDRVIPLATSLTMLNLIPKAQLHVFGQCGHWVQIEHRDRFCRLLLDFLAEGHPAAL
ncbi:MAG: alpha/beta fold hydrolase [Rhodospirillum sp.]|nr:alpha/beta fold hydrolase [Rhodospirillum sp.]MCF8490077.1 alpha/beta fold hydrolase [Rhodospirillum sp.]MCF8500436.1 alpha/beta fold hydrolase [Rhodospirillum sp.]